MLRQPVRSEARRVGGPTRRSDLDLLRALVVVGLVFFHSAVIFGPGEFPVKAGAEYPLAGVFLAFGATWGMPLLFVISGIGSWYSLGSRGAAEFARERLRRLGVPLLVGLLTLVPLQVYLGRRRAGETSSYADFSARFWDVRPSLEFPFVVQADPAGGLFETGHLWFLVCLLGFSLVLLPGLVLLGRPPGRRLIERLAGLLARPGGLLLPRCCRWPPWRSCGAARPATAAGTTPATRCSSSTGSWPPPTHGSARRSGAGTGPP